MPQVLRRIPWAQPSVAGDLADSLGKLLLGVKGSEDLFLYDEERDEGWDGDGSSGLGDLVGEVVEGILN